MQDAHAIGRIRNKYGSPAPLTGERMRRHGAAAEASDPGWGGVSAAASATGLARSTILAGQRELAERRRQSGGAVSPRQRRTGGGRKACTNTDPGLPEASEAPADPATRGHPESPPRWTCKSTAKLAAELARQNHPASDRTAAAPLRKAGYGLQANRKTKEGSSHPDRNARSEYIHGRALAFRRRRQPVASVDTKKKELVGEFGDGGAEWRPEGRPVDVEVHDFPEKGRGKAVPYGIYDLASNEGGVGGGIGHDTAGFAVASIRRWRTEMGAGRFPEASELPIAADGGGRTSGRNRLWKKSLRGLADDLGLRLRVCHFPPGTGQWDKIEHRLFCLVANNSRGRPLTSCRVTVDPIANTTPKAGLAVRAAPDEREYETGSSVGDDEMARPEIIPDDFRGEWNYSIRPRGANLLK